MSWSDEIHSTVSQQSHTLEQTSNQLQEDVVNVIVSVGTAQVVTRAVQRGTACTWHNQHLSRKKFVGEPWKITVLGVHRVSVFVLVGEGVMTSMYEMVLM